MLGLVVYFVGAFVVAVLLRIFAPEMDLLDDGGLGVILLWPLMFVLAVVFGSGFVLFYWLPTKTANLIEKGAQVFISKRQRRKKIPVRVEWQQSNEPTNEMPDWR